MAPETAAKDQFRYGIGEWYGYRFVQLTPAERRSYAEIQSLDKKLRPPQPCPFRSVPGRGGICTKAGGVCSLRLYHREAEKASVTAALGEPGILRATCPNRFLEGRLIFPWIGEILLGSAEPRVVAEIGFLESERIEEGASEGDDVGRIDHVLVHPAADPMRWCALEIQAVYFSGVGMGVEFQMLRHHVVRA